MKRLNAWAERVYPFFKQTATNFTLYAILFFIILIALLGEMRFSYA